MSDSSRRFRAAKARLLKRTLAPAGFTKGRYLFGRKTAGQIHGIEFQTSKYAGEYFVNVAFHYDFLPPLFALSNDATAPLAEFGLTDFMLYSRLENLLPGPYPNKWSYDDPEAIDAQLERNARDAIGVLDALSLKWRDPVIFLDLLPPSLLEENHRQANARSESPLPFQRVMGQGWAPADYFKMGYCLCVIALRAGRVDLAKQYLPVIEYDRRGRGPKAVAELTRQVEAAEKHEGA